MSRILVVDDEVDLRWAVAYSLRDEGYEVSTAGDGAQALAAAQSERPDLIILDIVMPGLDGLQVCRALRRDPVLASVPILFLTVRNGVADIVTGLSEGADDYLTKPFDLRVLKARVQALLRRARGMAAGGEGGGGLPPVVRLGPLTLDPCRRQVRLEGRCVPLSPAEFNLLLFLLLHPRQVFTSHELLRRVWNYAPGTADVGLVRWHVKNLRAKIEPDPAHPRYIRTMRRHGYLLDLPLAPGEAE